MNGDLRWIFLASENIAPISFARKWKRGDARGSIRRMTARIFIHTAVHKYPSCESRFAENDSHREIPSRCAICAQHSNIFIIDGYLGIVLHMEDDR